jgi:hypothetical protein
MLTDGGSSQGSGMRSGLQGPGTSKGAVVNQMAWKERTLKQRPESIEPCQNMGEDMWVYFPRRHGWCKSSEATHQATRGLELLKTSKHN